MKICDSSGKGHNADMNLARWRHRKRTNMAAAGEDRAEGPGRSSRCVSCRPWRGVQTEAKQRQDRFSFTGPSASLWRWSTDGKTDVRAQVRDDGGKDQQVALRVGLVN